ncbi:MAG TPA: hypothetical protein VIL36_11025 [Acidimicrobiales bacterium]
MSRSAGHQGGYGLATDGVDAVFTDGEWSSVPGIFSDTPWGRSLPVRTTSLVRA